MSLVAAREATGGEAMGCRLIIRDGTSPLTPLLRGGRAPVTQDWRFLGPEAVIDNAPGRGASIERIGAPVLGRGPE
jgi:hypothetical protein